MLLQRTAELEIRVLMEAVAVNGATAEQLLNIALNNKTVYQIVGFSAVQAVHVQMEHVAVSLATAAQLTSTVL